MVLSTPVALLSCSSYFFPRSLFVCLFSTLFTAAHPFRCLHRPFRSLSLLLSLFLSSSRLAFSSSTYSSHGLVRRWNIVEQRIDGCAGRGETTPRSHWLPLPPFCSSSRSLLFRLFLSFSLLLLYPFPKTRPIKTTLRRRGEGMYGGCGEL